MNIQNIQELNSLLASAAEGIGAQIEREEQEIVHLTALGNEILAHIRVKQAQVARMRETKASVESMADEHYVAPAEAPLPKSFMRPPVAVAPAQAAE